MPAQRAKGPPIRWQVARLALAGSSRQAFLDHRWIAWLFKAAPQRYRRSLAQRLLSLSPHYFIHQWDGYPPDWKRSRVLDAELERNRDSRRQIAEKLLAPQLAPDSRVLDFGCGPGFLAQDVSRRVREVVAVDISSGTLACARELNPGPTYKLVRGTALPVEDASIDTVYAIAVFQHLDPTVWPSHFESFARVLRPGGRGLCHFAIADENPTAFEQPKGVRGLYSLRYQESTSKTVYDLLVDAGFVDVRISPTRYVASIDDDVGRQHVAIFRNPD
jgi:SAM-dependent methyltransferase